MNNPIDNIIKGRRSTRQFTKEQIPLEDIESILDSARFAPCNGNVQPFYFVVVDNTEQKRDIEQIMKSEFEKEAFSLRSEGLDTKYFDRFVFHASLKDAPVWIFAFSDDNYYHLLREKVVQRSTHPSFNTAWKKGVDISTSFAVQNLLLTAESMGYATCVVLGPSLFQSKIKEYFGLGSGYSLITTIVLGKGAQIPECPEKKPLSNMYANGIDLVMINFNSLERLVLNEAGKDILEHSIRSIRYASTLNRELKGNELVVRTACLLHDVGYGRAINIQQPTEHANIGADLITENFGALWNQDFLSSVAYCVRHHSLFTRVDNPTPELVAVYDGEKIDFLATTKNDQLAKKVYASMYLGESRKIADRLMGKY